MAQKVGILDGEVNRNWHLVDGEGGKHLLSLFHDCVTGARAAMLDYEVRIGPTDRGEEEEKPRVCIVAVCSTSVCVCVLVLPQVAVAMIYIVKRRLCSIRRVVLNCLLCGSTRSSRLSAGATTLNFLRIPRRCYSGTASNTWHLAPLSKQEIRQVCSLMHCCTAVICNPPHVKVLLINDRPLLLYSKELPVNNQFTTGMTTHTTGELQRNLI